MLRRKAAFFVPCCRKAGFSTAVSAGLAEGVRRVQRPHGGVRAPYWRMGRPKTHTHRLSEEVKNQGDVDYSGTRLTDYWATSEFVTKHCATPAERIHFVNPYEREWTHWEKRWRRDWQAPLYTPRRAWVFPPLPHYFDTLNFSKYVTKSRLVDGREAGEMLDNFYEPLQLPILDYVERVKENILHRLYSPEPGSPNAVDEFLRTLMEDALVSTAVFKPELARLRISHTPRVESFWVRAGFLKMYKHKEVFSNEITTKSETFPTDDRRNLGELAFTMRDSLVTNLRREEPLKNLFEWTDNGMLEAPVFTEEMNLEEQIIFHPEMYGLATDGGVLYQCPGYDADVGETHRYGHLVMKSLSGIAVQMGKWRPDSEEEEADYRRDMIYSTAVTSLFTWLNAQAHCMGYTQFNEIERPFTSQLILSDGLDFYFAVGQLNTIAINIDVQGFENRRSNLCCIEGPHKLYQQGGDASSIRLNEKVVERLLQMLVA